MKKPFHLDFIATGDDFVIITKVITNLVEYDEDYHITITRFDKQCDDVEPRPFGCAD